MREGDGGKGKRRGGVWEALGAAREGTPHLYLPPVGPGEEGEEAWDGGKRRRRGGVSEALARRRE